MRVGLVDAAAGDAPLAFVRSMRDTGFAVLVNHGIDDRLVELIYREWAAFFASSAKESYLAPAGAQDGYFPYAESADGAQRDRKEYFHVRPGGRYPREVSAAALEYFDLARDFAAALLGWLDASSPGEMLPGQPLAAMLTGSTGTTLRVQHYLPVPAAGATQPMRAVAHTDLNLLTVLPAPTGPGLQVRDTEGRWHDVPLRARSVVINGGEMLESLTANYFPATLHRVANPAGPLRHGSRMSLPLFVHPAPSVVVGAEETAESFLQRRTRQLRTEGWQPVPGGANTRQT